MMEIPERLNYAEWDDVDFVLPEELNLKENSFLNEAICVFYAAGGYDFLKLLTLKNMQQDGWILWGNYIQQL